MDKINSDLKNAADKEKAKLLARYFKTQKGEYGEGDIFLGITVPNLRNIAKKYADKISFKEILELLKSKFHEERMAALLILVSKYKKGSDAERQKIFSAYLKNTKFINNWDLVDITCRDIVGAYLFERDRSILYKLVKSKNVWERRIAVVSTFYFISKSELDDTFKLAEILFSDKHDLIHKAVGWALRESGKKDEKRLIKFLELNRLKMPRTALRYAIERLPGKMRLEMLKK